MAGSSLEILYEDNHLIAVFKPSGVLVQGDISGDRCLMDEVKDYLKDKYKKKGNVFLGLVHRLDRPVAGVVLFAKTSKGASRISEQIRNREFNKTYYAVISGHMDPPSGKLVDKITKNEGNRVATLSDEGEEAILHYETIKRGEINSLIKINLITGRFHQIRIQMASRGYPIIGDKKYGSGISLNDSQIALCAVAIEFKKATEDELVRVTIDYPKEWDKLL
jgi:23S rRNA pseudouridine1911/1915/1917 synthase